MPMLPESSVPVAVQAIRQSVLSALAAWPRRRWLTAAAVAILTYLVVAVPTDLIDTPLFWRAVPPTWWSVPVLVVTAVLTGLLTATYVSPEPHPKAESRARFGMAGTIISFFAVGCPVCNKLVLLALGTSGAMQYFEPVQPFLAVGSVILLAWAVHKRLTQEGTCRVPQPATSEVPAGQ